MAKATAKPRIFLETTLGCLIQGGMLIDFQKFYPPPGPYFNLLILAKKCSMLNMIFIRNFVRKINHCSVRTHKLIQIFSFRKEVIAVHFVS